MEGAFLMAAAAAVPWKDIVKAVPIIVTTADKIWKALSSKSKDPPVDPSADLKTQFKELAARVQENESAQAEQAKVAAMMAEQFQALATRSARSYWVSWIALAVGSLSLAVALVR
jgi:1-acyl-sn-glycerol-3-phosphate acyltransferase